jgi:hypothetical protein
MWWVMARKLVESNDYEELWRGMRCTFRCFIHEGKVRAPAAAMALIERLGGDA